MTNVILLFSFFILIVGIFINIGGLLSIKEETKELKTTLNNLKKLIEDDKRRVS